MKKTKEQILEELTNLWFPLIFFSLAIVVMLVALIVGLVSFILYTIKLF